MTQIIKEEIANAITHGIGVVFAIVALTLMVVFAALNGTAWHVVSVSIYGGTLLLLYTMSTLYHSFQGEKVKKIFKVFDHASIYLLIAGTYTPFALTILREQGNVGFIIFGLIWSLAIIGIILSTVFIGKGKAFKTLCYIIMGWVVVFAFKPLTQGLLAHNAMGGLYFLIAGGLAYTLGCVFYMNKKLKYAHSIWHLFVLAGSVLHFIAVFFYII